MSETTHTPKAVSTYHHTCTMCENEFDSPHTGAKPICPKCCDEIIAENEQTSEDDWRDYVSMVFEGMMAGNLAKGGESQ